MGMNYLLDTHVLLWWLFDDPKPCAESRAIIKNPEHQIFVSSASAWEIATKYCWQVGKRIADAVLGGERAEYGKQVIASLAQQLTLDYGKGWSKRNLAQMVRFCEVFPDFEIVQTLSAQLSWSHFTCLVTIVDPLKQEFYLFYNRKALLKQRLHQAIINARLRFDNKNE